MEAPEGVVKTVKDFAKGSVRLVKRCTKPDRKGEDRRLLLLVAVLQLAG